jgi:hypothetical protein
MVVRGEVAVGLTNVWLQTAADGLVCADQVTGTGDHQAPALSGKPLCWLLDVVVPVSTGNGTREDWGVTVVRPVTRRPSRVPVSGRRSEAAATGGRRRVSAAQASALA